jgi:hypothetical protein
VTNDEHTTGAIQLYLDALDGKTPPEPIVRALLERSAHRLQLLCTNLLYRKYRRLTLPPLNLQRQFFALVNQHMRWELNDLARRLDEDMTVVGLCEGAARAPASSGSALTPDGRRIFEAIDHLPEEEREVFGLVHIQGLTHAETAELMKVSTKTVQRRLNRSILLLKRELDHLRPTDPGEGTDG